MRKDPKRRRFALIAAIALTIVLCLIPLTALGDAGGYSGSTDYGGSSDWGSSSSDWGSSSSDSYYYGDGSSSSSSEGSFSDFGICAVTLIVIFVLAYFYTKAKGRKSGGYVPGATRTDRSTLKPISDLIAEDPDFSEAKMDEKISNIYVQMQNAWTAKDFESMRPYFSDALYTQFDRQLDVLRQQKKTNHIDNISVLGVQLDGWYQTEENDCIVADVSTRIIDYVTDDRSGEVVEGDAKQEKFMVYEYTLIRTKGGKTTVQTGETETINCPNCGAPLNINQTTKCPYCDSVVTVKDFDWVISAIKGISQQTG